MPRYFFHVHDGTSLPDADGTELPDLDAAREEAVRMAGTLLNEHARAFWSGEPWFMEVQDEWDVPLFTLSFAATEGRAPGLPRKGQERPDA